MNEYQHRSQLLKNEDYLKQSSPSIEQQFPNIKSISIQIQHTYHGVLTKKELETINFSPKDKSYFKVQCINSECFKTDLDLKHDVTKMISQKESFTQGNLTCNGYQTYSRYLSGGNHCLAEVNFEIKIDYL